MPEKEKLENHYPGDEFHSTAGSRSPLYYLFLGSRWFFFSGMALIVLESSRYAVKGLYTTAIFIRQSLKFLRLVEKHGCPIHMEGIENISSPEGPVVFISNHMSSLETVLLPGIILPRKDAAFIVKKSLADYPFFGNVIRAIKHIPVTRTNPREDLKTVTGMGLDFLRNGVSVIVFPQATRSSEFVPEDFNSLGIKLAAKSGATVIPLALRTNFWGNGKYLKELGPISPGIPVRFKFGKPFKVSGNGKEDHQKVISFISETLAEWKRIDGV